MLRNLAKADTLVSQRRQPGRWHPVRYLLLHELPQYAKNENFLRSQASTQRVSSAHSGQRVSCVAHRVSGNAIGDVFRVAVHNFAAGSTGRVQRQVGVSMSLPHVECFALLGKRQSALIDSVRRYRVDKLAETPQKADEGVRQLAACTLHVGRTRAATHQTRIPSLTASKRAIVVGSMGKTPDLVSHGSSAST